MSTWINKIKTLIIICILLVCAHLQSQTVECLDSLNLLRAIQLIEKANLELDSITDYSALIISTERIKNKKRDTEYLLTRYKEPGLVYLKWLPGPYSGNEASYIPERDGRNSFLAIDAAMWSWVGSVRWKMDSPFLALFYPHHFTIRNTNLKYFMEISGQLIKKGRDNNLVRIEEIVDVFDSVVSKSVTRMTVVLSDNPADSLLWTKAEVFFDKNLAIPLHFKLYDFDGELWGEYAFIEFRKNTGLNKNDFGLK